MNEMLIEFGQEAELVWNDGSWSVVQCGNDLLVHRHDRDRVVDVATLHVDGLGWDWTEREAILPIIMYAITGSASVAHRVTEYADLS